MARLTGRRRFAAGLSILAVAAFATVATSPPYQAVESNSIEGALHTDVEHPLAVQEFTVTLSDVAMGAYTRPGITVRRTDSDASVRLTIAASNPGGAAPTPAYGVPQPAATEIAPRGSASLTLDCESSPCERTYRLFAERIGGGTVDTREPPASLGAASPAAGSAGAATATPQPTKPPYRPSVAAPGTATWEASGVLGYSGNWPSGASMTLTAGGAVSITGKDRSVGASVPDQTLRLDGTHPAAAALVEVRIAASAVPANPADVVSTGMLETIDLSSRARLSFLELSTDRRALNAAFMQPQFDPLAGCTVGAECVHRYVVSAALAGADTAVTWRLRVSQLWLRGTVPASDAIQMSIQTFTVSAASPQTFHAEGDLTLPRPDKSTSVAATARFSLAISPAVTAEQRQLLAVLPVAAFATVVFRGSGAAADVAQISVNADDLGSTAGSADLTDALYGNPFARSIGYDPTLNPLEVSMSAYVGNSPYKLSAPVTIHWTLDLTFYSFEGMPPFQATQLEPAANPAS